MIATSLPYLNEHAENKRESWPAGFCGLDDLYWVINRTGD